MPPALHKAPTGGGGGGGGGPAVGESEWQGDANRVCLLLHVAVERAIQWSFEAIFVIVSLDVLYLGYPQK